jgi:hypothetical protein
MPEHIKFVKSIELGEDDGTQADAKGMTPQQIADALVQIDPDDLLDTYNAIHHHIHEH